jgi:hypothetical protein
MVLLLTIAIGVIAAAVAGMRPTPATVEDWTQALLLSLVFALGRSGVVGSLLRWRSAQGSSTAHALEAWCCVNHLACSADFQDELMLLDTISQDSAEPIGPIGGVVLI